MIKMNSQRMVSLNCPFRIGKFDKKKDIKTRYDVRFNRQPPKDRRAKRTDRKPARNPTENRSFPQDYSPKIFLFHQIDRLGLKIFNNAIGINNDHRIEYSPA